MAEFAATLRLLFFACFLLWTEQMQCSRGSEHFDKDRLEKQKHIISDTAWKDIKQRELKILEQERKIQEVVFSRIYQRHTKEKVLITSH